MPQLFPPLSHPPAGGVLARQEHRPQDRKQESVHGRPRAGRRQPSGPSRRSGRRMLARPAQVSFIDLILSPLFRPRPLPCARRRERKCAPGKWPGRTRHAGGGRGEKKKKLPPPAETLLAALVRLAPPRPHPALAAPPSPPRLPSQPPTYFRHHGKGSTEGRGRQGEFVRRRFLRREARTSCPPSP